MRFVQMDCVDFCFIIDILYMKSFVVLKFLKETLTKNWSFNHIKDILKIFTDGNKTQGTSCSNFVII